MRWEKPARALSHSNSGSIASRLQSAANPSPTSNSLLTGKLTGNFVDSGPPPRFFAPRPRANSMVCREIPYATEQGSFGGITGNFFKELGMLAQEHEIRPCDQSRLIHQ